MAQVTVSSAYVPVEVDLWGEPYVTVAQTRSVVKNADKAEEKISAAGNSDQLVKAICEVIDLRVKPKEGDKKAGALIDEKWKADELSIPALLHLLDDIREADHPH